MGTEQDEALGRLERAHGWWPAMVESFPRDGAGAPALLELEAKAGGC